MSTSSPTTTATLVAVAENSCWYRIHMPRRHPQQQSNKKNNNNVTLHYEPVMITWVVSHQKTGQKIVDGSIDQTEIHQNMLITDENANNTNNDDYYEWTTQVVGLQSNSSYVVNFEVVACCTQVDDDYKSRNQENDESSSSSTTLLLGETKHFILDGSSFSTLRQPVVLRCVWRQCQSAVVYVTRQFPGREKLLTESSSSTISRDNNNNNSDDSSSLNYNSNKNNNNQIIKERAITAVEEEKPKEQWLADTVGSPFIPQWVAQIEVYDAETRKLVGTIISNHQQQHQKGSNNNNNQIASDERQRHLLIQNLSVSHPYSIRVRAIYTNVTKNVSSSSSSSSSKSARFDDDQQQQQENNNNNNRWFGPWSSFTLFRTRGPFLVRAVKTSVRYAHLMVPDILNERYDRIPPFSILENMPTLHPSFMKAEWLSCVGSVVKPKVMLSGKLANPLGSNQNNKKNNKAHLDSDTDEEEKKRGAKEGMSLLEQQEQEKERQKQKDDDDDNTDDFQISESQLFSFDNDTSLDDPTPILGLQPDTEYLGDAVVSCDLPPFASETVPESRVFFRTQPKMLDGEGGEGGEGGLSGLYGQDSMLMTHATGLLGSNSNKKGGAGGKDGRKPAVPYECSAMSVESAASLLATETSAKIGWSLIHKSFETSMQVVSAYEPRFYLVRFGYMKRGAYRLTEADRNLLLGATKIAKEADWDDVIANTHRAVKHALSSVVWKGSPNYSALEDGNNNNESSSLALQYIQDAIVFSADRTVLLEQLEPDRRILVHVRAIDVNPLYLLSVFRPGATFKDILEISPPEFLQVFATVDRPAHFPVETNITAYVTLKPPELDVKEYEVGSEMREGNLTVQLRPGIIEGERAVWRKDKEARRGKLEHELNLKREMIEIKRNRIREERKKAKEEIAEAERRKQEKEKRKYIFQQFVSTTPTEPIDDNNNEGKKKKKKKAKKNKNSDDDDDENDEEVDFFDDDEEEEEEPITLDGEDEQLRQREEEISQELELIEEEPEEFVAHAWYHAQNTLSYEIVYAEDLSRVMRTCQVDRATVPNGLDPKDCDKYFILPQIGRGAFRFIPRLSQGDGSFGRRGQNLDIVVRNVEIAQIENDGKRGLRIFINKDDLDTNNSAASKELLGAGRIPVVSGAGMLTCLYLPFGDEDEAIRRKHGARIQLPVPPQAVDTGYIDLSPLLPGQYDVQVTLCIAGYVVAQEGNFSSNKQKAITNPTAAAEEKEKKQQQEAENNEASDNTAAAGEKGTNDDNNNENNNEVTSPTTPTPASPTSNNPPFCLPLSSSYDAPPRRGTVLRHFQLLPVMVCEHFVMLTVMATREQPPKNQLMTPDQFYLYNQQNPDKPLQHNHLLGFLEASAKMEPEPIFSNRGVPPPSVWESASRVSERQYDNLSISQQRRLGFLRRIHHIWMQQVKASQAASSGGAGGNSFFDQSLAMGSNNIGGDEFGDAMAQFDMQQSRFFGSQVFGPEEEETEFARTFEERFAYTDFTRQDCFEVEFEIAKHGFYDQFGAATSDTVDDWTKALPPHEHENKPQRLLWSKGRTNKRPCEIIAVPLKPSTLYDFRFRIRPMDARQDFTHFSPPETFATATPWQLDCTAVTEQSATIQWSHLVSGLADQQNNKNALKSHHHHHRSKDNNNNDPDATNTNSPTSGGGNNKKRPIVLKWTAGRIDLMKALLNSRMEAYEEQLAHITDEEAGDLYSISLSDVVMEVEISLVLSDKLRVPSTFIIPGSVANVIIRGLEPGCDYECRIRQTLPESSYSNSGNNRSIAAAFDTDAGWSKPLKLHTLHNIRAHVDSYGAHHCCVLIKQAQRNTFHVPDLKFVKNSPKRILDAVEAARAAFASGEVANKINQDRGMLKAYECAIHVVKFDKASLVDPATQLSRAGSMMKRGGGGNGFLDSGSISSFGNNSEDNEDTLSNDTLSSPTANARRSSASRQPQQVLKTIDDVRDLAIPHENNAISRKMAAWVTNSINNDSSNNNNNVMAAVSNINNRSRKSITANNNQAATRDQVAMANFDELDAGICYQVVGRTVLQNGEVGQWTRLAVVTTYPLPDVHLAHVTQDASVFVWTVPDTDHHINETNTPKMSIESVEVRVEGKMLASVYRSPIESFESIAKDIHKSTRTQLFPLVSVAAAAAGKRKQSILNKSTNSAKDDAHQQQSTEKDNDDKDNNNDNTATRSKKHVSSSSVLRSCVFFDLVPNSTYIARIRFKDNFGKWSRYGRFPIRFKTLPMIRCSALCVGDDFAILGTTHDRWYERSNAIESTRQDSFLHKSAGSGVFEDFDTDDAGLGVNNNNGVFGTIEDTSGEDDESDGDDELHRRGRGGRGHHNNKSNRNASTVGNGRTKQQQQQIDDESLPITEAIPFLMREDEIEWTIRIVPSESIELVASSRDVILRWAKQDEHTDVRPMSFGTYMLEGLRGHYSYSAIGRAKYRDANLCPIDSLKRRAFETTADIRVRSAVAMFSALEIDQLRRDIHTVLTSVWSDVLSFKTTPPVRLKVVRLTHSSVIVDARRYASIGGGSSSITTQGKSSNNKNNNNDDQENDKQRRANQEAAESALRTHCGALFVASKCLVQLQGRSKVHKLNLPLNSKKGAAILIVGFSADAAEGAGKCRRLDLSVQCTTTDVADALQREAPETLLRSAFKVELPPDVVLKGKSSFIDDLGSLPRRPSIPILYECQIPSTRSRRVGASDHNVSRSVLLWWGTPIQNEDTWPGVPSVVGDDEWPDRLQEQQLGTVSMIEDGFAVENDDRDKEISDYIDREYDMSSVLVIDLVDQQMVNKLTRRRSSARRQSQVLSPKQSDPEIKGTSKKFEVEIAQVDPLLKVRSAFVPLATIQGNRPYLRVLLDDGAPPLHHIMFRVRSKIKVQSCGLETELATFYSAGAAWRPPENPPPPRKLRVENRSDSSLVLFFNVDPIVYEQHNQPRFEITFPGESEHVLTVSHPPVLISRLRTVKTYTIQVTTVTSFGRSDNNPTIKWRSPSTAIIPSSPNLFPEGSQLPVSLMIERLDKEELEEDTAIANGKFPLDEREKQMRAENRRALEVLEAVAAASSQFPSETSAAAAASSGNIRNNSKNNNAPSSSGSDVDFSDGGGPLTPRTTKETDHFRWHWPFPQPLGVDAFPPCFGLKPTSFHFAPDFETRHDRERRLQCGSDAVHIRDLPKMNYAGKAVGRVFYSQTPNDDATAERFVVSSSGGNANNDDGGLTRSDSATRNSNSNNRRGSASLVMSRSDATEKQREDLEDELGMSRGAIQFGQQEVDAVTKQLEQSRIERAGRKNASLRARRQSSAVAARLAAEKQEQQQRPASAPRRKSSVSYLAGGSGGIGTMGQLLNRNLAALSSSQSARSHLVKEDKTGVELAELSRSLYQQQQDREKQKQKELKRQKRDEKDRIKLEKLHQSHNASGYNNSFFNFKNKGGSNNDNDDDDDNDDEHYNDEDEDGVFEDPFSNIAQLDTMMNAKDRDVENTNPASISARKSIQLSLRKLSEQKLERSASAASASRGRNSSTILTPTFVPKRPSQQANTNTASRRKSFN